MLVVGRWVCAAWEMSQESLRSHRGRHKPSLILTLTPTIGSSTMPPCVSAFTRPCGQARGGAGRVPGAAAAPLDHLSGLSDWRTYRRNYTKPPVGFSPFLFRPSDGPNAVADNDMPPAIARTYLLRSMITAGISHIGSSHRSHTTAVPLRAGGHTHTVVCVTNFLSSFYSTPPILNSSVFPLLSVPHLYANSDLSFAIHQ